MTQPVFLSYDQAGLDAQYDNQNKIEGFDFKAFVRECDVRSADARARHRCVLDIPYGPSEAETLDVFQPPDAAPGPVNVFFHGGYWRMLDKKDFSYVADGFVPHGITTVVVNYALIPAVDMDGLVEQCRRSVRWVAENVARFGGDPGRIFLTGHSAGGHLVAMMLATDWPAGGGAADIRFESACAISGLFDLEPIRLSFLNRILRLAEGDVVRNSPVLLPRRAACPMTVVVGEPEGPEYLRQSRALVDAWGGEGGDLRLLELPGEDHFSLRAHLGDPESDLVRTIIGDLASPPGSRRRRPAGR